MCPNMLLCCVLKAIQAEGTTLVDLLDTYMKTSIDKSVVPFGDGLHLVYDEPWNPPGWHLHLRAG